MASRESGVDMSYDNVLELTMEDLDNLAKGATDIQGFYKLRSTPIKLRYLGTISRQFITII